MPSGAMMTWISSSIGAGSNTTATTLRSVLYNRLKHPATLNKLLDEFQTALKAGKLSKFL
jgi:cytochrome P450